MFLRAAVLALAVVLTSAPAGAHGQDEGTQAEARRLFEEGRAHAQAEHWPDAVASFERSRALLERPSTLFNLASAYVRVGRSREALAVLTDLERIADPQRDRAQLAGVPALRASAEASLRHVVLTVAPEAAVVEIDGHAEPGTGARRELTLDPGAHAATVSLDRFGTEHVDVPIGVDTVEITLHPHPARVHVAPSLTSAAVTIDGVARGLGVVDVVLEPGTHVLEVSAHGHEPLRREIDVAAGDELAVAADLVPTAEPPPPPPADVDVPLIVGLSIGGALVAGTVATILAVVLGTTTEMPSGGSTNVVIAVPLVSGTF